jgi:hypothetical protein
VLRGRIRAHTCTFVLSFVAVDDDVFILLLLAIRSSCLFLCSTRYKGDFEADDEDDDDDNNDDNDNDLLLLSLLLILLWPPPSVLEFFLFLDPNTLFIVTNSFKY